MKTENPKVAPGKPGTAQAKTVSPAKPTAFYAKPIQASVTHAPSVSGTRQAVAGEERRRSQRVLLKVKVNIHVPLGGKNSTFEVTTLSVNDHGALVALPRSLALDTRLILEHTLTRQQIPCTVVRTPREMPEGFHTPLEFDKMEPNFWGIAFPPADWRPPDDF